jgi:hypothetical protein
MAVKVTWQPSTDPDVVSFTLEKSISMGGPWSTLATISAEESGPNWDPVNTVFFYDDSLGNEASWYRLTATDSEGQSSSPSDPFRAATTQPSSPPALVNTLAIHVGDVAILLGMGFSTIEIYESRDRSNSFHELTSPTSAPATAKSAAATNTFRIGGLSLSFKVNGGATNTVTFSSVLQDWTPAQVAQAINLIVPGVASVSVNAVVLTSPTTGRVSSIEIVSSPASLGFRRGITYGTDGRLELVDGVFLYKYYDVSGSTHSRYKWRFSSGGAAPFSKYSDTILATPQMTDRVAYSVATALFLDVDGQPLRTSVIIAPVSTSESSGYVIGAASSKVVQTDENGFLQVPLVCGETLRIAVEGTGLVREIVVPNTATFDLFQALSAATDQFTVQTVPPQLTRRSL